MSAQDDLVLVVKHTFLEYINEASGGGSTCRSRCRTMSDTGFHLPEAPESSCQAPKDSPTDDASTGSTMDEVDTEDEDAQRQPKLQSQATSSHAHSWAEEHLVAVDGCELIEERSTVMFRNVPNDYTRDHLMKILDEEGFEGKYNFIYLPVDFRSKSGFGYAFINLINGEVAEAFKDVFNGFQKWSMPSQKVAEVTWSHPSQGLDVHVERYRNSPVMHEAVPDAFKPAMFENGNRISFPPPTKAIRMPRIRHSAKRQ